MENDWVGGQLPPNQRGNETNPCTDDTDVKVFLPSSPTLVKCCETRRDVRDGPSLPLSLRRRSQFSVRHGASRP